LADEVASLRKAGLDCVVSLLDSGEIFDLDLGDEEELCKKAGMEFVSFPITDRGVPPSVDSILPLVDGIVARLAAGKAVGVHCRVGIGRSGLISACVLLRQGMAYADVFPALSQARGVSVPDTSAQEDWVRGFAARVR